MKRYHRSVVGVVAGWLLLAMAGCGSGSGWMDSLDDRYRRAVADAAVAEPGEVSHALQRIVPDNTRLRWRTTAAGPQVLLVTWTSWNGYDAVVGQPTRLAREVWVTCVPELQEALAAHPPTGNRELRAAQLLGLPPAPNKSRFVELWAAPADLFRPAADPDITTATAPSDGEPGLPAPDEDATFLGWYGGLKAASYGPGGYPWTRLGYTYDWGDPSDEEGLSEFVIRAGATVDVANVATNAGYLGPN